MIIYLKKLYSLCIKIKHTHTHTPYIYTFLTKDFILIYKTETDFLGVYNILPI
jgi:hypothetical protein